MPKQEKIEYLRQFPGIENDPTWKAEMEKEGITVEDLRQPQDQTDQLNIQEAPEEPGTLTTMAKGAAAGAVKGLTKNWYDDAFGNLAALAQSGTGNPYMPTNLDAERFEKVKEEKAQQARDVVEGAAEAAPLTSAATEIIGQGVSDYYLGGGIAKVLSPVAKLFSPVMSTYGRTIQAKPLVSSALKTIEQKPILSAASNLASGAAQGAVQGAIPGALSGAITGAGTATGDKLEGAVSGAETGGLFGAGTGLLSGVVGVGRDILAKRAAGEEVAKKVQGMTAEEIKNLKNTPINERVSNLVEEAMPVRERAFTKASEEAANIKNTLAEVTKEIGSTVNKGKASAAKEVLDKQPLINTLQETLPSLEGSSRKLVKRALKTLEKPTDLSAQKAERIANVLENNANSAPSTIAPLLKDVVSEFRNSVKAALPEETSKIIEGTKDILTSQIPKAAKKSSPEKFVKVLTSKANEFSTKKAFEQAKTITGKELPSFKTVKGTADLLRKIPTEDPAAMEAFLIKSLQYEAQLAKGVTGDALKTQGERDFYELLAKTGSIKESLLNLRAAFATNPKIAKEYFQRKSAQGAIELAKGNLGNAASDFFQANAGGLGGTALRSYGVNTSGWMNRVGRAATDTLAISKDQK